MGSTFWKPLLEGSLRNSSGPKEKWECPGKCHLLKGHIGSMMNLNAVPLSKCLLICRRTR